LPLSCGRVLPVRAFFAGTPSTSPADLAAHGSGWLRKAQNVEERKLDEASDIFCYYPKLT